MKLDLRKTKASVRDPGQRSNWLESLAKTDEFLHDKAVLELSSRYHADT